MENTYLERLLAEAPKPLTIGENLVLREYLKSKQEGWDTLTLTCISWEQDHADMIRLMQAAGIRTFVLADTSTGLMGALHAFLNSGFEVQGPKIVKPPESNWGKPVLGLEMRMKR